MGKAQEVERIESDGYPGVVYENPDTGRQFVSWRLAQLMTSAGNPVTITGITGRNGSVKAAAYNLANGPTGFLQRVLRSRMQWGRDSGSIVVSVPGAQLQGTGYDAPIALRLEERIASAAELNLALSVMAKTIATVTARGVYARFNAAKGAEGEEAEEELGEIKF